MNFFKLLNVMQRNTSKLSASSWILKAEHKTVAFIHKHSSGVYLVSLNCTQHKTFMGALASLVKAFEAVTNQLKQSKKEVLMNTVKTVACAVLMCVAGFAHASNLDDAVIAKTAMGENAAKLGVLTHSFTEQGLQNSNEVGVMMAEKLGGGINDLIAKGLDQGMTCSDMKKTMIEQFSQKMPAEIKSKALVKKTADKLVKAIGDYTLSQCLYLTE